MQARSLPDYMRACIASRAFRSPADPMWFVGQQNMACTAVAPTARQPTQLPLHGDRDGSQVGMLAV